MSTCSGYDILGFRTGGSTMPTLSAIKSDISSLSNIQITELFEYIEQLVTINSMEKDLQKDC